MNFDKSGAGRVLLVATLTVLMLGTVSAQGSAELFYKFDGGCPPTDSSGNNRDGSCFGNIQTGQSGLYGSSYGYSTDTGTYVETPFGSSMSPPLSIATEVYIPSNPSDYGRIFSSRSSGAGYELNYYGNPSPDKIEFAHNTDSSYPSINIETDQYQDSWVTLIATVDSNGDAKLFVEEYQSPNASGSIGAEALNSDWTIGARADDRSNSVEHFNGKTDNSYIISGILNESQRQTFNQCGRIDKCNTAPSIDSVSTSPSSWTLGSDVNVSADVVDGDGTVSGVSADVWENGSQIVSDASLSDSDNDGEWNISDLFTVDESDVYYNVTLTATDDDGATDTTEISQLVKNKPPKFQIQNPGNTTGYDYDREWKIKVEKDGDNVPNEDITCKIYDDGNLSETVALKEGDTSNNTASGTHRHDKGSYLFEAECSDPDGNTQRKNVTYSIDYFDVVQEHGPDVTYETRTPNFDMDLKNGDMINEVKYFLDWNQSVVESSDVRDTSGITTNSVLLTHPGVPLVESNSTEINWSFTYQVNRTTFDGNLTLENYSTSENNQSVRWSYWENQSYFDGQGRYIEREDFKHYLELRNKSGKASIKGTTTYHRNGETASMSRTETSSKTDIWMGSIDSGSADSFNQSSFDASSELTLSFRGSQRKIKSGKDSLDVHKIKITGCGTGLSTEKALTFDTNHETGGYDVTSDLVMDSTVWKTGEVNRSYNFQSNGKTEHDFCIYPSWAEYNISTTEQLIQFQGATSDLNVRSHFLGYNGAETISNSTMSVPLRLNNDSATTRINFEISDPDGNAYPFVICRIDRYFPGEGKYETVAMIKTGSQGETETFLEKNEIYYSTYCYKNGELLDSFESQTLTNPMRLQIGEETTTDYLDWDGDLGADCSSNTTQVSCDYQSSSESLEKAVLKVKDIGKVHTETVCQKTSKTATGTLICDGLNTTENSYRATLTGYYPDDTTVQPYNSFLGKTEGWSRGVGLLATAILFIISFLGGGFHPVAGISLGLISLIMSQVIGIFPVSQDVLMSIVAVGVVTGWVITR